MGRDGHSGDGGIPTGPEMVLIEFAGGSAAGRILTAPPNDPEQPPPGQLLAVQHRASPGRVHRTGLLGTPTIGYAPFDGAIFIVNSDGGPLCELPWDEGTDQAADRSLTRLGLHRLHDWSPDRDGRRTVQVATALSAGELSGPAVAPPTLRSEPNPAHPTR